MEFADHIDVELEGPGGMMTTDNVQLADVAIEMVEHIVHRHLVRALGSGLLGIVAELAGQDADVGRV